MFSPYIYTPSYKAPYFFPKKQSLLLFLGLLSKARYNGRTLRHTI